ncbi:MAG: tetratricopeptide repeat protein [Gammaproteobacteria bacterium]|nr:tetratricopeptide repeat protein [Gammaproteobacteria bacterium]
MNRKDRRAAAKQNRSREKRVSIDEAVSIAIRLHQDGHFDEAETIYEQVLKANPQQPDALHFLGVLSHQQGKSDKAIDLIRKAIFINPNHPDFHNNLGNILKETDKSAEAAEAYQTCLDIDPKNANALCNLGAVLKDEKRYEEALTSLLRAIELAPKHSQAYHNLGNVYRKLERNDEALAAFRESIKLIKPEESAAYVTTAYKSLGRMLYRERKFDEAAAIYRQLLTVDPGNPTAEHLLAACSGKQIPDRASDAFVAETFDIFAGSFDQVLQRLEYRAPELVMSAIKSKLVDRKGQLAILDAGCGTGLLGVLIRDYANNLVGVDLSEGMIDKAKGRGIYDDLEVAELTEFMVNQANSFDLIASADTLCYFGDLRPVLLAASGALTPKGLCVFTLEKAVDPDPEETFRLNPHGRYSHTRDYVTEVTEQAGMKIEQISTNTLRNEGGVPVEGFIVTAVKT